MKSTLLLSMIGALIAFLSGCTNVQPYTAETEQVDFLEDHIQGQVYLGHFIMPEGNRHTLPCRHNANAALPDDVHYAGYIHDAFAQTLIAAEKFTPHRKGSTHQISADIEKIHFVTEPERKWVIAGHFIVDGSAPVRVISETYTSSCNADTFEDMLDDFIERTFTHPLIISKLTKE